MSWRTVLVTGSGKLSYENNCLIVRADKTQSIHLGEINTIVVDSTGFLITTYLISKLQEWKIKLIFCDSKHNPCSESVYYYGAHDTSKKIVLQTRWSQQRKDAVWTEIIRQKIKNQAMLLRKLGLAESCLLEKYVMELEIGDVTNREGHAAKVYFNGIFGKTFSRDSINNINAILDYGYTILLSAFNREIVSRGYLTQLGLHHKNEFNQFNLSCDLLEPFRILVDEYAVQNSQGDFTKQTRIDLVDLLNKQILYKKKTYFLVNAIEQYVLNVLDVMNGESEGIELYEFG